MNRSNGTWVKNMCQKLENICMDLDEFVCKEPVLFVGNQMEAVGENVKNFFSGFMDDFVLTQVVDPVQHVPQLAPSKCSNLVETSTSSVVEIEEDTCHKPSSIGLCHSEKITSEISQHLIDERESENLDKKSEEGVLYDGSLHSDDTAFDYSDWGIENILDLDFDTDNMNKVEPLYLEKKKTLMNSPVDELEWDSNTSTAHPSSELEGSITCNASNDKNAEHVLAGVLSSEKLYESLNASFRNATVEPDTINSNSTVTVDYFSDFLSSCGPFTTLACDSNNEAYESCSGTGGSVVDFEDVKTDNGESCVIVEGGKFSTFPNTSRSKSYKKMIQDAFMSRKRISKEYKQLAIWYGDIDKELCLPTGETSKPPVQDLPDSEWELL